MSTDPLSTDPVNIDQNQPVTIEVTVDALAGEVWQSLRDPERIRRWHGWQYEQLDEEIRQIYLDDVDANDETYVLTLGGGDRFEVQPGSSGTRLVLTRGAGAGKVDSGADEITEGWLMFLHQLKFMLERQPETERRTLFYYGSGDPEALPRLLHTVPAEVGVTWYRTGHQQGVILPDLGPGLLITAGKSSVTSETGETTVDAMAVVTMYDLLDGEFGIQRDIWSAWWRSAYPDASEPQT
jgi:uncharacterized protein YndB with AHSA1/START domain